MLGLVLTYLPCYSLFRSGEAGGPHALTRSPLLGRSGHAPVQERPRPLISCRLPPTGRRTSRRRSFGSASISAPQAAFPFLYYFPRIIYFPALAGSEALVPLGV